MTVVTFAIYEPLNGMVRSCYPPRISLESVFAPERYRVIRASGSKSSEKWGRSPKST